MSRSFLVKDYMACRLITLEPDAEIMQAVNVLLDKDIAGAPVVGADGTMVGVLTEKDCMRVIVDDAYHSEKGTRVSDYMSTNIEVMAPDDTIKEAASRFLENRYHRYPVMENNKLVGQISRRDVMRALGDAGD